MNDTGRTTETADRWLEELTRLIAGDYEGAVDEGLLVIGRSSALPVWYRFRVGKSGFAICLRHIEGPEVIIPSRWNIVRARHPSKPIAELLFLTLARHNFVNFRFWMN